MSLSNRDRGRICQALGIEPAGWDVVSGQSEGDAVPVWPAIDEDLDLAVRAAKKAAELHPKRLKNEPRESP